MYEQKIYGLILFFYLVKWHMDGLSLANFFNICGFSRYDLNEYPNIEKFWKLQDAIETTSAKAKLLWNVFY